MHLKSFIQCFTIKRCSVYSTYVLRKCTRMYMYIYIYTVVICLHVYMHYYYAHNIYYMSIKRVYMHTCTPYTYIQVYMFETSYIKNFTTCIINNISIVNKNMNMCMYICMCHMTIIFFFQ